MAESQERLNSVTMTTRASPISATTSTTSSKQASLSFSSESKCGKVMSGGDAVRAASSFLASNPVLSSLETEMTSENPRAPAHRGRSQLPPIGTSKGFPNMDLEEEPPVTSRLAELNQAMKESTPLKSELIEGYVPPASRKPDFVTVQMPDALDDVIGADNESRDSGFYNSSKNTTSGSVGSSVDSDSENAQRGAFDYYPKTKTKSSHSSGVVTVNDDTVYRQMFQDSSGGEDNFKQFSDYRSSTRRHRDVDSSYKNPIIAVHDRADREMQPMTRSKYSTEDYDNEEYCRRMESNDKLRRQNDSCYDFAVDARDSNEEDDERPSQFEITYTGPLPNPSGGPFFRSEARRSARPPTVKSPARDVDEGLQLPLATDQRRTCYDTFRRSPHDALLCNKPPFGDPVRFNDVTASIYSNPQVSRDADSAEGSESKKSKKRKKAKKDENNKDGGVDENGNPLPTELTSFPSRRPGNGPVQGPAAFSSALTPQNASPITWPSQKVEENVSSSNRDELQCKKERRDRKKKGKDVIMSNTLPNYKGDKDFDSLLKFIEGDKSKKKTGKDSETSVTDKTTKKKKSKSNNFSRAATSSEDTAPRSEESSERGDDVSSKTSDQTDERATVLDPKDAILSASTAPETSHKKSSIDHKLTSELTAAADDDEVYDAGQDDDGPKMLNGSATPHVDDVFSEPYIFTDYQLNLAPREEAFQLVNKKSRKGRIGTGGAVLDGVRPAREVRETRESLREAPDWESIGSNRQERARIARIVGIRSKTPPPVATTTSLVTRDTQRQPLAQEALSPSSFPCLTKGRRNSAGDVEQPGSSLTEDSDLESQQSVASSRDGAEAEAVSPRSLSWADRVAQPKHSSPPVTTSNAIVPVTSPTAVFSSSPATSATVVSSAACTLTIAAPVAVVTDVAAAPSTSTLERSESPPVESSSGAMRNTPTSDLIEPPRRLSSADYPSLPSQSAAHETLTSAAARPASAMAATAVIASAAQQQDNISSPNQTTPVTSPPRPAHVPSANSTADTRRTSDCSQVRNKRQQLLPSNNRATPPQTTADGAAVELPQQRRLPNGTSERANGKNGAPTAAVAGTAASSSAVVFLGMKKENSVQLDLTFEWDESLETPTLEEAGCAQSQPSQPRPSPVAEALPPPVDLKVTSASAKQQHVAPALGIPTQMPKQAAAIVTSAPYVPAAAAAAITGVQFGGPSTLYGAQPVMLPGAAPPHLAPMMPYPMTCDPKAPPHPHLNGMVLPSSAMVQAAAMPLQPQQLPAANFSPVAAAVTQSEQVETSVATAERARSEEKRVVVAEPEAAVSSQPRRQPVCDRAYDKKKDPNFVRGNFALEEAAFFLRKEWDRTLQFKERHPDKVLVAH